MDYRQTACSQAIFNRVFLNGCGQNLDKLSENVKTFANITTPTPVPRPGSRNGGGGCDCTIEWNFTGSGTNWNSSYVGQQEFWQTASANPDMLTVQSFVSGSNVNLGLCQYEGFKAVAGGKQWHGTYGWNQTDGCSPTASAAPSQTKYRTVSYDVSFSNTFNAGEAAGGYLIGTKSGNRTVNLNGIISSSLITTQEGAVNNDGHFPPDDVTIYEHIEGGAGYFAIEGVITETFTHGGSCVLDSVDNDLHCGVPRIQADNPSLTLDSFVNSWNQAIAGSGSFAGSNPDTNPFVGGAMPAFTDPDNYSGTGTGTLNAGDETWTADFSWTRTETEVSWNFTTTQVGVPSEGEDNTWSYSGTITLGDAYAASDVESDVVNMLASWPLNNNAIYPWRTDSMTMYMPLVARREVGSDVNPIGFNTYTMDDLTDPIFVSGSISEYGQIQWEDPNNFYWLWVPGSSSLVATGQASTHFDGAMLGQPFLVNPSASVITGAPTTGSGAGQVWGWFNFYYNDFRFCKTPVDDPDCGSSPPWELYLYRSGGTLADCDVSTSGIADGAQFINLLPKCSTYWTSNIQAHSIPKGASIMCGIPNIGGIWIVKYAECRPKYPSHNFFRPCGMDRAAIDETTAQCFIDDLVMLNPLTTTSGQLLLTFTDGFDGIYTGCSQSPVGDGTYNLTLGTKVRDLPSGYYHPFGEQFADADLIGDYGLVGNIRFPDAWALCGREGISVASSSNSQSVITFGIGQPNLLTGDVLAFYNSSMGLLVSSSVVKLSDNEFSCSVPFTSSIHNAVWAQSNGSPDYHWNDTAQKLQYRQGEWKQSNRTGITTSSSFDSCVSGSPCAESVICFSPNGETFHNGTTTWFSGSTQVDEIFGSLRQLNVEFGIVDPFYQQPKTPCTTPDSLEFPKYVQDDGTCPDDGSDELGNPIIYYPPAPYVEAMTTMPAGAPAFPSGITWPQMSQPQLPGVVGFSFLAPTQPWQVMAAMANTCANNTGCRFIIYYTC